MERETDQDRLGQLQLEAFHLLLSSTSTSESLLLGSFLLVQLLYQ